MFDVSAQVEISLPPAHLWWVLTNFPGYAQWHPFVAIKGDAVEGAEVEYSFLYKGAKSRALGGSATVSRVEALELLVIDIGIRGLFRIEESYRLGASGAGTLVTHKAVVTGLMAHILGPFMRRQFLIIVRRPIEMLALHVKRREPRAKHPLAATRSKARPRGRRR